MKIPAIILATVSATVALATPALAQMAVVEADHNGSVMRMETFPGGHTVIRYIRPRDGLQKADVVPGMIVFTGQQKDGKLTGKAYAFKAGCRPADYDVTGTAESATTIVLRGAGPQRRGCDVVGFKQDSPHSVLTFTFGAGTLATFWDDPSRPRTGAEMREILTQPPPPSPVTVLPTPTSTPPAELRPSSSPEPQPQMPATAKQSDEPRETVKIEAERPAVPPVPPASPAPEPRVSPVLPTPMNQQPAKPAAEPVKKPKLDADL